MVSVSTFFSKTEKNYVVTFMNFYNMQCFCV